MSTLNLADIQGNILRGYRKSDARHFAVVFDDAKDSAQLLKELTSGVAPVQITRAVDWDPPPRYCLNVGLTAAGMRRLGMPSAVLDLFPQAFVRGPVPIAEGLGDTGESSPQTWIMGGPRNATVHALVSLYSTEVKEACLEELSVTLRTLFETHGVSIVHEHVAHALPEGRVHFRYRDGIAQPRVAGAPGPTGNDRQPLCKPGEFLLGNGYINQYGGNFAGDLPNAIVGNGTFAALRILEQKVFEFERWLKLAGARYKLDPELVAAKLMGRWRNGAPLMLYPDSTMPNPDYVEASVNDFDYGPDPEHPTYFDDTDGRRCPLGSHIRRMNPRSAVVMGKPHTRRIIRRGMAYGAEIAAGQTEGTDEERGLFGFFICGDLEYQFEFLMKVWANKDIHTHGIQGTTDPIIGKQPELGGQFVLRTDTRNDPVVFNSLPQFIRTRGSAYFFLPGITGLNTIASMA